jgi:hypothetical protein
MLTARRFLAIAGSLFLSLGVLCSQVCDTSCAFNGCASAAPAPVPEHGDTHCSQHDPESAPQKNNDPAACQTHAEAAALKPSSASLAGSPHQPMPMPAAGLSFWGQQALDHPAGQLAGTNPFRSPPARPLFSVLRI